MAEGQSRRRHAQTDGGEVAGLAEISRKLDALKAEIASLEQATMGEAAAAGRDAVPPGLAAADKKFEAEQDDVFGALERIRAQIEDLNAASPRAIEAARPLVPDVQPAPPPPPLGRGDRLRRIEERLAGLATSLRGHRAGEDQPAAAAERAHEPGLRGTDLTAAITQIAARQHALETEAARPAEQAPAPAADPGLAVLSEQIGRIEQRLAEPESSPAMLALDEHMKAFGERIDRLDTRQEPDLSGIEHGLAALGERLDEKRAEADRAEAALAAMAERIDGLAERFESLSADALDRAASLAVEAQLGKIESLMERVSPQPIIESLETGLRDINSRLAALETQQSEPETMERIAEQVASIAEAVDHNQKSIVGKLVKELDKRVERIGILIERSGTEAPEEALRQIEGQLADIQTKIVPASEDRPGMDAVEARLDEIADMLGTARDPAADDAAMRQIERQISDLADKIDALQSFEPGESGLRQIEDQVARIAALVERQPERDEDAAGAVTLDELRQALEQNGAAAIEQARAIAEDTARRILAEGTSASGHALAEGDELFRALRDGLVELKDSAAAGEQRQRDAFSAVHTTLMSIVDRLGALEDDHGGAAAAVKPEASGEAADYGPVEPVPAPATDAVEFDARNLPLEPGSGRPQAREETQGEGWRRTDGEKDAATTRADFIAAARRAAQQASAEAAAEQDEADATPSGSARRQLGAAFARMAGHVRPRRKPLILTAAAVILVMGAVQIYGMMTGTPERSSETALEAPENGAEPASAQGEAETEPSRIAGDDRRSDTTRPAASGQNMAEPENARRSLNDVAFAPSNGEASRFEAFGEAGGSSVLAPGAAEEIGAVPDEIRSESLRNAALAGDPAALFEIGARYTEGRGVERDLAIASEWYRHAAQRGMAPAQYRLGSMYEKGNGRPLDLDEAQRWYALAAEQGNRMAMHNLGVISAEGSSEGPDFSQAVSLFTSAADLGVKDSQFNLGVIHARGLGTPQDLVQSYKWFDIAARTGDRDAERKRDEVAEQLGESDLARARAVTAAWEQAPLDESANEAPPVPAEWADPSSGEPAQSNAASTRILVQQAQTLLAQAGFDAGPVDGMAGGRTRDAVLAFQRSQGLPETGNVTAELVYRLGAAGEAASLGHEGI